MERNKKIYFTGKQIFDNQEDLAEGFVEIGMKVEDVLDHLDREDITNYVCVWYGLIGKDDCEPDIDDFHEDELVQELKDNNYNFAGELNDDDIIEEMLERGLSMDEDLPPVELDYVDSVMLDEIINLFYAANWEQRKNLHNLICNG